MGLSPLDSLADFLPKIPDASRREFLKLMGASLGLAGLTGCIRMPEEKLAPYAHRPQNRMPGVPVSYATAMEIGGIAQGLLVTSIDGRPIKIEGNPSHPLNRGACDAIAQASILQLYDPDRSRGVIRRENGVARESSWEEFAKWAKEHFKGDGDGVCFISEASTSPSLDDMRSRLQDTLPHATWLSYEPLRQTVHPRLFEEFVHEVYELSEAKVIVSLDTDLFGGGSPMAIKYGRDFAVGRRPDESGAAPMNRLCVVESLSTITGACADYHRVLRPSAITRFVAELAYELGVLPNAGDAKSGIEKQFIQQLKADLVGNAGKSVIVGGPRLSRDEREVVRAMNLVLGNQGKTVFHYPVGGIMRPQRLEENREVREKLDSNSIEALVILGGNPVYDAPADFRFGELVKKVKHTIHLGPYLDETSKVCDWHLSQAHYLESWGDARAFDGTVSIGQPLIEPLFDGRSAIELLAIILGDKTGIEGGGYAVVRRTFHQLLGNESTDWRWKNALAEGIVHSTALKPPKADNSVPAIDKNAKPSTGNGPSRVRLPELPTLPTSAQSHEGECELVFFTDSKVYDGRFANNGWLQELPDPMTRLTWDNAALMSPKTAEKIGVKQDELVAISPGDKSPASPVGTAENSPAVHCWDSETPQLSSASPVGTAEADPQRFSRPYGRAGGVENALLPSDESLGYSQATLQVAMPVAATISIGNDVASGASPAVPAAKAGETPAPQGKMEAGADTEVLAPAFFVPGMADGVIGLALGYGRTAAGSVGNGVGVNAYVLRDSASIARGWRNVKVRPTGKMYRLATVQDHHIVDPLGKKAVQDRIPELVREGTLAEFKKDPALGIKPAVAPSIFDEHGVNAPTTESSSLKPHASILSPHRWGMAIDLGACTGCGACVVACQAENNIPIVGKEQVLLGREMHWIRVDRYFRDTPGGPAAVHQPVPCMQCENAPCEEVCPFAATTHSQEGLNMMTYNRCGGTRYCSNNCPYKVRRFNFFDYNRGTLKDMYLPNLAREPVSELVKMQKNPEVTVRMRGVMEKCTYCIQRIERARITAKREGDRPIADGEIRTACQQSCPTGAIVFGDLNDPQSRVSKLCALPRCYGLLDTELNTRPRTRYLVRVRNAVAGLER
jgi:Fe-S-cluster-containing dehydrogenase component